MSFHPLQEPLEDFHDLYDAYLLRKDPSVRPKCVDLNEDRQEGEKIDKGEKS